MSFSELKEVDPICSTAVHVDACFLQEVLELQLQC